MLKRRIAFYPVSFIGRVYGYGGSGALMDGGTTDSPAASDPPGPMAAVSIVVGSAMGVFAWLLYKAKHPYWAIFVGYGAVMNAGAAAYYGTQALSPKAAP